MWNPSAVRITNDPRPKFTYQDGSAIRGVRRATVRFEVHKAPIVELELLGASVDCKAQPKFHVADPESGEVKQVRTIFFRDGSIFSAPE